MPSFSSLSLRLALTYAGLFIVSVLALGGLYYWFSVALPMGTLKERIDREAKLAGQLYIVDGPDAVRHYLEKRASATGPQRAFHAFILPDGRALSSNLLGWPRTPQKGWLILEADINRDGDEDEFAPLVREVHFRDGARLVIGRDAEDLDEITDVLSNAALWGLVASLMLGPLGGLLMSRAIGQRLEAINTAARQVMTGDLSGRVPLRGSGDDFDQLGETLNLMLSRIEELVDAVRRVSDNVAHELRTPLARLMLRLEQTQDALAAQPGAVRLDDVIDEARRLQRIFDALLRIARLESGRHMAGFRPTDISLLAGDAVEFHAPLADANALALTAAIEPGLTATVDPDLLFQALSNLLDNALKHVSAGGHIELSVRREDDRLLFVVSDDGPGMTDAEMERATERFFRGASSALLPGEGLGLSLVAAIARLHGGAISFAARRPGLAVTLVIPVAAPAGNICEIS